MHVPSRSRSVYSLTLPMTAAKQVAVRQEKGKSGEQLSMGFGFVECSSEEVAKAVLKRLQVCHQHIFKCCMQCRMVPSCAGPGSNLARGSKWCNISTRSPC